MYRSMGQAKQRRERPCLCGAGLPAASCCYGPNGWSKSSAVVQIIQTGHSGRHAKCYLNSTEGCSDQISKEHLISQAVLKIIAEKSIEISGAPWLKGETKTLSFGSLVSNCLCNAHNNALTNLDAAAGKFFDALRKCGTTENGPPLEFIFNGHDIERWMLKTLSGLAASNYLADKGQAITDGFEDTIDVAALLSDPTKWIQPAGLYFTQRVGERFRRDNMFHLAPLSRIESNKIAGMIADVQGLHVALFAIDQPIIGTPLEQSSYRPGKISFSMGDVQHTILISWDDNLRHNHMKLVWEK